MFQPFAQRLPVEPRWGVRRSTSAFRLLSGATAPHTKPAGACVEIVFTGIRLCERLIHGGSSARQPLMAPWSDISLRARRTVYSPVPSRRGVRRRGRYGQASLDPKPAVSGFGWESSLQQGSATVGACRGPGLRSKSGLAREGRNQPFLAGGCWAADRRPRRIAAAPADTANSAAPAGPATQTGHG